MESLGLAVAEVDIGLNNDEGPVARKSIFGVLGSFEGSSVRL